MALLLGNPNASYYANNRTYTAAASGLITVNPPNTDDIADLLAAGCVLISGRRQVHLNVGAVKAASATGIVASAALSNGTLTIAGQTDVPRPLQGVIFPGTTAITAGVLTMTYTDEIGVTRTDAQALATGASTNLTFVSSHGCSVLASAIVTGLTGGTSPGVELGTNANLAAPMDEGANGLAFVKASSDNVNDTLPTIVTGNIFTPNTAPNGTHILQFDYTFYTP